MKGNKPDFHQAMAAEPCKLMYDSFLDQMRAAYTPSNVHGRSCLLSINALNGTK